MAQNSHPRDDQLVQRDGSRRRRRRRHHKPLFKHDGASGRTTQTGRAVLQQQQQSGQLDRQIELLRLPELVLHALVRTHLSAATIDTSVLQRLFIALLHSRVFPIARPSSGPLERELDLQNAQSSPAS